MISGWRRRQWSRFCSRVSGRKGSSATSSNSEVATTAITAAELLYGVARLPVGRRKTELADTVRSVLEDEFHGRVEPFDVAAAGHLAWVVSTRDATGRPISVADAQIAAVCRKLRATLATRNVKDFEGAGIAVIDPWDSDRARN